MKNKINLNRSRIDCILIWGHGLKYLQKILLEIENHENFEILKIIRHIPKTQKQLVKEVYSYDYAPFEHLKDKTKYLKRVDKQVAFILLKNIYPDEDLYGRGPFRHVESVSLKIFKEQLRDKYNPYVNGIRSHNHILHACDNQTQTHFLLKYLGYENGLKHFLNNKKILSFPDHIKHNSCLTITKINYNDLVCRVAAGDSWDSYSLNEMEIKETPHYKSILDNSIYERYLKKFLGGPIKDYNSPKKFKYLKSNFKYLQGPYYSSYIIVKKHEKKYLILDGIHRASLHFFQGNESITACLIN